MIYYVQVTIVAAAVEANKESRPENTYCKGCAVTAVYYQEQRPARQVHEVARVQAVCIYR